MAHKLARLISKLVLPVALLSSAPAFSGELLRLPVRPGTTQSVYLDGDRADPAWIAVLFAGDNGVVRLAEDGATEQKSNFLIRTAGFWRRSGNLPVIFDSPSDHPGGMDDLFRLGDEHAGDVKAVVAALRQRYPNAKVALVGTSRGTISVGNLLKRQPGLADAFVLTSPVTRGKPPQTGLSRMSWSAADVPVLVVANEHDACAVSPFDSARSMAQDNKFQFIAVSSDNRAPQAMACQARTPHGFLGIEENVLKSIQDWLAATR
jgi:alpha/beta superfamily hydrolase